MSLLILLAFSGNTVLKSLLPTLRKSRTKIAQQALVGGILLCLCSCANQGSGPDGGPYDETAPRVVGMTLPTSAGSAGKRGTKISIKFSEPVQIENAAEKVIVSPPQMEQPEITAMGRKVSIHLLDTLRPNTTYTIDFADAITDVTEKNPLGHFTYIFSTGEVTDTMEVSGHVLDAQNLEPMKNVLVGLYPADSPFSIFRTEAMHRVARTNGDGHFSIKGVRDGEYRVVCLQDMDQDFRLSMKNELLGWARSTIRTSSFPDVRYDTTWIDTTRWSRIDTVQYTHYLPDDVVVCGFMEANQPRHKLKENREQPDRLRFFFTAPSDSAPTIRGLNFDERKLLLEHSAGFDTLCYWITDTALVNTDTLQLLLTYDESDDSTGLRALTTDTLEMLPRTPLAKRLKQQAEEKAKWEKGLEKRHKRGDYSQETPSPTFIRLESKMKGRITPLDNIRLTFNEPIDSFPLSALHLMLKVDSTEVEAPYTLTRVPQQLRSFELRAEWRPHQQYRLHIDSAAVTSIYGRFNDEEDTKFSIVSEEDYGTIFITIPDADSTTVVQLITEGDKVVREQRVKMHGARGGLAEFYYIQPGTYYYRCYFDRNGDGLWTPGNYDLQEQPEEVYYSPVKIEVKANFDFDQTWRLSSLPLTQQKPRNMVKQKGDKRAQQTAHDRNIQRLKDRKK